jgi:hypothetical protein
MRNCPYQLILFLYWAIVLPQLCSFETYSRSRMTGDLSKIYVKIGATRANINFLSRCRKCKLIPKGFTSQKRIATKKSGQLEERFARIRMRETLNALHAKLFMLELDIKLIPETNRLKYTPEVLKQAQNREYFTRMRNLNRKFSKLMAQRNNNKEMQFKMDAVLNRSSKELTAVETRILARGFKFRPSLQRLPIKDIVIGIETLIKTAKMPPETATELRNITITEIDKMQRTEKRKPSKPNLSRQEWQAVKTLAADTDRRIVKGDKGDKSIVMDYGLEATECEEGTTSILNETIYLAKLLDRIQPHIKIEEADQHMKGNSTQHYGK